MTPAPDTSVRQRTQQVNFSRNPAPMPTRAIRAIGETPASSRHLKNRSGHLRRSPQVHEGKFVLMKNEAQTAIGKIHRIGGLAISASRKDKLDDPLSANGPDGIADTILRPDCFTFGVSHEFYTSIPQGRDFRSGAAVKNGCIA